MGFLSHAVEPALSAVLNTLWQGAALALLVWVVLRFLPRMNASTRHAVWWASLAALVLLPAAVWLARFEQRQPAHIAYAEWRGPVVAIGLYTPPIPTDERAPVRLPAGSVSAIALGIWLAAAMVQLARVAASYRYLRGIRRRARTADVSMRSVFDARLAQCGLGREIELLVSSEIVSPMAAGFFHPAVILPESLAGAFEESELDYVLLHELAHLARRDNWTNLAARLAAAFVGLHPVAFWMLRRIERERELACDDWVVSFTGAARPYAATLARLFEVCAARRRVLLATGMAGAGSQLGERIEGLLRGRDFAPRASVVRVAACAMLVIGLVSVGIRAPRWVAFAQDRRPAPAQPVRPPSASHAPQAQVHVIDSRNAPANNGFMAALTAAGYNDISVDEIISLKSAGINAGFILAMRDAGWGKPRPAELILLAHNGVSPKYAEMMGDAGLKGLTLEQVTRLHQNGARAETIGQMHSLGFGPFTAQEAIELANNGVSMDTLRALKDAGLTGAGVHEIVRAHHAGLRENDVRAAQRYSSHLTLDQILKLKQGGVL